MQRENTQDWRDKNNTELFENKIRKNSSPDYENELNSDTIFYDNRLMFIHIPTSIHLSWFKAPLVKLYTRTSSRRLKKQKRVYLRTRNSLLMLGTYRRTANPEDNTFNFLALKVIVIIKHL